MMAWNKSGRRLGLVVSVLWLFNALGSISAQTPIGCLQTTSTFEDLVTCFDNFTVREGSYTADTYAAAQPTRLQLDEWEALVASLMDVDGNCTSLAIPASIADIYHASLFVDSTGPEFCVVSEINAIGGVYTKGWALLAVPATQAAVAHNIHISAPHPFFDLDTPEQAGALFKSTGARSLLIAGREREAYAVPSDCITTAATDGGSVYFQTDPAHNIAEPFFPAIRTIWEWQNAHGGCPSPSCGFIQLHGKAATTCPTDTMFLTTGLGRDPASLAWYTSDVDRPVKRLKASLIAAFPDWTMSLPSDSNCSLIATDNVFGRLVNGVPAPRVCNESAIADFATGQFVHVEQAIAARNTTAYAGWTAALLSAFAPTSSADGL